MSPLAKQVIDVLVKEEDNNLLAEVLDFYEYLKEKKRRIAEKRWQQIQEDDATTEEKDIISRYESNNESSFVSISDLTKELGIDE